MSKPPTEAQLNYRIQKNIRFAHYYGSKQTTAELETLFRNQYDQQRQSNDEEQEAHKSDEETDTQDNHQV